MNKKENPKEYILNGNHQGGCGIDINSEPTGGINMAGTKWWNNILFDIGLNDNNEVHINFCEGSIRLHEDGTYSLWSPVG